MIRLTAAQRRSVVCPSCLARKGEPCKGSRIPSASTLGGGCGGPVAPKREHAARITLLRSLRAEWSTGADGVMVLGAAASAS